MALARWRISRLHASSLLQSRIRCLHCSASVRILVGPPDPVSNLRPVIYDDDPTNTPHASSSKDRIHPYSLDEFNGDPTDYQWRLERQRLDLYNHAFWSDSNARFEAAKKAALENLPDEAPPESREAALSDFYKQWLMRERHRQKEYTDEWRRRNYSDIILAARIAIRRFRSRMTGIWTQSKNTKDSP